MTGFTWEEKQDENEFGFVWQNPDEPCSIWSLSIIDSLLPFCCLSPERLNQIEKDCHNYTVKECNEVIHEIREHMCEPDPAEQFKSIFKNSK